MIAERLLSWPWWPPEGFALPVSLGYALTAAAVGLLVAGHRTRGLAARIEALCAGGLLALYGVGDPAAAGWTPLGAVSPDVGADDRRWAVFLVGGLLALWGELATRRVSAAVAGAWLGATCVAGPVTFLGWTPLATMGAAVGAAVWPWVHDAARPVCTALFGASLLAVAGGWWANGAAVIAVAGVGVAAQWMTDPSTRTWASERGLRSARVPVAPPSPPPSAPSTLTPPGPSGAPETASNLEDVAGLPPAAPADPGSSAPVEAVAGGSEAPRPAEAPADLGSSAPGEAVAGGSEAPRPAEAPAGGRTPAPAPTPVDAHPAVIAPAGGGAPEASALDAPLRAPGAPAPHAGASGSILPVPTSSSDSGGATPSS